MKNITVNTQSQEDQDCVEPGEIMNITEHCYAYDRQSSQPEWFDSSNPLHFCDTSGSSPFNEWAGFHNEKQAREWINKHVNNPQSFIDSFEDVGGEYYAVEDLDYSEDEETSEITAKPKIGARPASTADLVSELLRH